MPDRAPITSSPRAVSALPTVENDRICGAAGAPNAMFGPARSTARNHLPSSVTPLFRLGAGEGNVEKLRQCIGRFAPFATDRPRNFL
jgi:hypothetical protein